jgi:hypothetical protein
VQKGVNGGAVLGKERKWKGKRRSVKRGRGGREKKTMREDREREREEEEGCHNNHIPTSLGRILFSYRPNAKGGEIFWRRITASIN